MPACPKCGLENPAGSKFCAGCGTPIPVSARCASCGAESPPGSKFCKKCGAPLEAGAAQPPRQTAPPPPGAGSRGGIPPRTGAAAPRTAQMSEHLSRLKTLLWASIGIYAVGLFFNFSELSKINQIRQLYGPVVDTSKIWFLILLDGALAALTAYAAMELMKGSIKAAKASTVANAILGAVATLLFFKGGIISIALNGGLCVCGVWGRLLISKEERPLV
jgi:hypothetical protein